MTRPYEVVGSAELARHGRHRFRADEVEWPDGARASYAVLEQPEAAVIVPVSEVGSTYLVRQWRHAWEADAWELPAGTIEDGEEPEAAAHRELIEEAGLDAAEWESLGTARATVLSTMRFYLFLARGLRSADRRPELYERDMVVREVPFDEALDLAADGSIQHAATIAALYRAARRLQPGGVRRERPPGAPVQGGNSPPDGGVRRERPPGAPAQGGNSPPDGGLRRERPPGATAQGGNSPPE